MPLSVYGQVPVESAVNAPAARARIVAMGVDAVDVSPVASINPAASIDAGPTGRRFGCPGAAWCLQTRTQGFR